MDNARTPDRPNLKKNVPSPEPKKQNASFDGYAVSWLHHREGPSHHTVVSVVFGPKRENTKKCQNERNTESWHPNRERQPG